MAKDVRLVIKLNEPDYSVRIDKNYKTLQDLLECFSHAGLIKYEGNEIEFSLPAFIAKRQQWQRAQDIRDRARSFGLKMELKEVYRPGRSDLGRLRDEPIKTRILAYEELLMLTNGIYPDRYCPKTNDDEMKGVIIDEHGKLTLKIGRGFESPRDGHKVMLIETDPQGRMHYQMDTGLQERRMVYASMRWIPESADVLVAGLGLGVISLQLAKKPRTIHVVEVNPNVRYLIWHKLTRWCEKRGYPGKLTIEDNDIQNYLRFTPNLYDVVYLDIWDATTNKVKWGDVVALEDMAKRRLKPGGRVITWARKRLKSSSKN